MIHLLPLDHQFYIVPNILDICTIREYTVTEKAKGHHDYNIITRRLCSLYDVWICSLIKFGEMKSKLSINTY